MKKIAQNNYIEFLGEIKERIRRAQYDALKAVNKQLITLYGDIGRMIVERQNQHGWGKSVVENLAKDLQMEFPGIQGYSAQNLWRMRQFYLSYIDIPKLSPLVREIGWSHNVIILMNCKDNLEREFYIRMTRKFGWTKNVLIHQIENKTYEKTMLNQTNFSKVLPEKIRNQAKLAVKDEYTFDFLELGDEHSEMELERALMSKINRFLIEMGGVFTFVGNQFRLEINGKEFFIDILLYHRRLKCLVAIELKIVEFKPEHAGKMQFYLAALDDLVKMKEENPSIGIILCKDKDRTIVEYALRVSKKPIGVATYKITTHLPVNLIKELPSPEQVAMLIEEI
ncbi:MAG: PDDEXK nuclease domain-containing protein [Bacteroidota bacterium]